MVGIGVGMIKVVKKDKMKIRLVCNRCDKEYPLSGLDLDYSRILNEKTGESLDKNKIGVYRIMDMKNLPCGHRDCHWVFVNKAE